MGQNNRSEKLKKYLKKLRDPEAIKESLVKMASSSRQAALEGPGFGGLESMAPIEGFPIPAKSNPPLKKALDLAKKALEKVQLDRDLTPDESNALEAIILPAERPVIFIQNGTFQITDPLWDHFNQPAIKGGLEKVFPAIGRIELPSNPRFPYVGTGFVVAKNLLMTNRHVAELFSSGLGKTIVYKSGESAGIDFIREYHNTQTKYLEIQRIAMIHPYWDMALLEVKGIDFEPLRLGIQNPQDLVKHDVAVIGYPGQDYRNDFDVQRTLFQNIFYVKRLQPGQIGPRMETSSFGKLVSAMTHDCSTLGGNSGSAIIHIPTMEVIGLHFAGVYLEENYSVPMAELAADPRVADCGLNFAGPVSPSSLCDAAWQGLETSTFVNVVTPPVDEPEIRSRPVPTDKIARPPSDRRGQGLPSPVDDPAIGTQEVSLTIPLEITINLKVGAASRTVLKSSPASPRLEDQERLFSRSPTFPDPSQATFPTTIFGSLSFSWDDCLAAAMASKLAYEDSLLVEATGTAGWGFTSTSVYDQSGTRFFVAKKAGATLLAFRGTAQLSDWLINLNAFYTSTSYGSIHQGFYSAFQSIKPLLEEALAGLGEVPLFVTGHSLGGALATLFLAEYGEQFNLGGAYTFGQPCVGLQNFQADFNPRYGNKFYRLVNDRDVVTSVPPGYSHVGKLYHFGSNGNLQALPRAIEAFSTDTLTEAQFEHLKDALRRRKMKRAIPGGFQESFGDIGNLEGWLPWISDHMMDRYLEKILRLLSLRISA